MASWQARAVSSALRHTLKRKLARAEAVSELRGPLNAEVPWPARGVTLTEERVGGVPGEWVCPRRQPPVGTLLYLHGGGYFTCSPRTHRTVTTFFARNGWRVFAPDYRLAPEYPYPAALEDVQAATAGLEARVDGGRALAVAGDSAGGGLALALLLAERQAGRALPGAVAVFSPWTDLAVTGASVTANEDSCAMFTADAIRRAATLYPDGADPQEPLISPLYGDLHGLPPLLIHAGEDEILRDDAVRFACRAEAAGVSVSLRLWPTVPHAWQLFHPIVPEGRESLRAASAFLLERTLEG